jgi:hypothetical protein
VASTAAQPAAPTVASTGLTQNTTLPSPPVANATAPTTPSVDAIAWSLLRETTDDTALKRFVEQYPDSSFRNDAETRISALVAERAAKAEAAAKAQADADKLAAAQQSTRQPESPVHSDSGLPQLLAGSALIQAIKMELTRVGCYAGKLDDDWTSPAVKQSIVKFVKAASLPRAPDNPSPEFLGAIRNQPSRVCPLECGKTEIESNGKCIAKSCPSGQKLDDAGDCVAPRRAPVVRSAPTAAPTTAARSAPAEPAPQRKSVAPAAAPTTAARSVPAEPSPQRKSGSSAVSSESIANHDVGIICGRFGCKSKPARAAPAGIPCAKAIQDRSGGWHCT